MLTLLCLVIANNIHVWVQLGLLVTAICCSFTITQNSKLIDDISILAIDQKDLTPAAK